MIDFLYYIVPAVVTYILLMKIIVKYNWNDRLWERLNQKRKITPVVIWLFSTILIQIIVQIIFELIGIVDPYIDIFVGISFGTCIAFMPKPKVKIKA